MTDDAELLRRFAENHSNADFTEFVGRHFSFVYHAALRRTGGRADLAQDVAQQVFIAAARQGMALSRHPVIEGWLYTTTRHAANNLLREERRRAAREQEAERMKDAPSANPDPQWHRVRQELDTVMDQLPERDREAILLRFFHDRPFAQIGATFGLSEEAARKRVDRALERLRACLVRRGITSTSAALGAMLSSEAALAAPAGLAKTVAGAALTQAAGMSSPAIGAIQLMSTKTTLGIAGTLGLTGVLGLTAIGVAIHQARAARRAEAAFASAQHELQTQAATLAQLRRDADRADATVAEAQGALDKLRSAAQSAGSGKAAAPAAAPARNPRTDGRKLLATMGPARAVFHDLFQNYARLYNPQFYRIANFTPAQIEEFENRSAAYGLETLMIFEEVGFDWKRRPLPEEMRQMFGDEVARKFAEYRRNLAGHYFANEVALAVGSTAPPLSDDQIDQVVRAIADNNSDYRAGKKLPAGSLSGAAQNWDAVIAAAKTTFSPEQWKAAEPVFAQYLFSHSIEQAKQAMMAAAPANPKR